MKPSIARRFIEIEGITLHYRECNNDAKNVVFMLHPSPMSSAVFETAMAMFPRDVRVIALDTPGYGLSQSMPTRAEKIADYLPTLRAFFSTLAGDRFKLYGSATGAQLALGYANAYPQDVVHLYLDNAAHFDDDVRTAILARYFIDITPKDDGSHLALLWDHCRKMLTYFPWFETNDAHRTRPAHAGEPTAAEIQTLMAHYLAAGPRYAEAYAAAFQHERAPHYQSLTVPTTLFRWLGSPLLKEIDHLISFPLPACVRVVETPAPIVERYQAVVRAMTE
jgi:pimeloyl-ACP methyl ester carboxylesterase